MKRKLVSLLLCSAMTMSMLAGCAQGNGNGGSTEPENESSMESEGEDAEQSEPADVVMKNGVIQTMVSETDTAQAIAISGSEIIYVGDDAGVESFIGDETNVIDLDGQMVTPGFMDGHLHPASGALNTLFAIDLTKCSTNEEYIAAAKEFIEKNPDMDAYTGSPFQLNAYQKEDGSNPGPQKEELDAICPDKPVTIYDVSHHSVWVNSKALELAGITKDTPNPQGGVIHKNEAGEPSGYLTDAAADLVAEVAAVEYTDEMYQEAITAFQEEANSMGITGVTNILVCDANHYKKMEDSGDLTLRMRMAYTVTPDMSKEEAIAALEEVKKSEGELISSGTVKIFADGVTESATAVMLEPYLEAAGKGADWKGESVWNVDDFQDMIIALDKEKYQIHVHAIGDGAVNQTLNAYEAALEENGKRDSRHTMTHVCAITDEDIKRDSEMGIINALQFLWMYADPLYELEAAFIGEERALAMYPTLDMKEAGCLISGASDAPVTGYNPLEEIEVGVTRNSPYPGEEDTDMHRAADQALTAYDLLEAYTKNVAYQNFQDEEIGTIEVGKKADLAVLSQNILTCEPSAISDTEIIYTLSNGKIVYEK